MAVKTFEKIDYNLCLANDGRAHKFEAILIWSHGIAWRWCRDCKDIQKPCEKCQGKGKDCSMCSGSGYVWIGRGETRRR